LMNGGVEFARAATGMHGLPILEIDDADDSHQRYCR
jgi:hypothetical protein